MKSGDSFYATAALFALELNPDATSPISAPSVFAPAVAIGISLTPTPNVGIYGYAKLHFRGRPFLANEQQIHEHQNHGDMGHENSNYTQERSVGSRVLLKIGRDRVVECTLRTSTQSFLV
jgi:hypothetical protein